MSTLLRGRVYWATISEQVGRKPYLVVSNNQRNRALGTALAVRLTTSPKPPLPSVVPLTARDPLVGRVLCDDVVLLFPDEVEAEGGALSPATMRQVEDGLLVALGIRR